MIKQGLLYILFMLACSLEISAQTTGSSPYSQYGLGLIKGPLLPQNRAMGGIGAAVNRIGAYNNINLANPASYSDMRMTTFDIGAFSGLTALKNSSLEQKGVFNASLSHIVFGVPVTKRSALSFGLVPYSDLGYKYKVAGTVDTNAVNYVYAGDGGLSKAHIGYGFHAGKHFSFGANVSYIFGKLEQTGSAEFLNTFSIFNSRSANSTSVGGLNYDYGVQYTARLNTKTLFTAGFSGSTGNKVDATLTKLNTLYFLDPSTGEESGAADTISSVAIESKIKLPAMNRVGFTIERSNKWLIGADLGFSGWSSYRVAGTNPGLKNSFSASVGGQITPDITSVANYLKLIDYRFGLRYDKTYISVKNTDIKDAAITFGLGLPLPSNRGVSFYKINFSSEFGQRGSLANGLVRERYSNFNIGVTLNDLWFQKFKFD